MKRVHFLGHSPLQCINPFKSNKSRSLFWRDIKIRKGRPTNKGLGLLFTFVFHSGTVKLCLEPCKIKKSVDRLSMMKHVVTYSMDFALEWIRRINCQRLFQLTIDFLSNTINRKKICRIRIDENVWKNKSQRSQVRMEWRIFCMEPPTDAKIGPSLA